MHVVGWAARAVLVTCVAAGCASSAARPGSTMDAEALERLYLARADSARQRFDAADVAFVTNMIGHHAQAIEMSELAPSRAADPAIRTLAARIVNAQRDEIALMEQWLRERGQPLPDAHMDHAMPMPGMLAPEELAALGRASGAEFDRLFLGYMIRHHEGAVAMVEELLASDSAVQDPATFKLASDIHVDQTTEINRMRGMLRAIPSGDPR